MSTTNPLDAHPLTGFNLSHCLSDLDRELGPA
jgi:hypothetical protein